MNEISNVCYAKSCVVKGQGIGLVCAVGVNTQYGISLTSSLEDLDGHILEEKLEFKDMLESYSIYVGRFANYTGIFFFIAMCVRFYLESKNFIEVSEIE